MFQNLAVYSTFYAPLLWVIFREIPPQQVQMLYPSIAVATLKRYQGSPDPRGTHELFVKGMKSGGRKKRISDAEKHSTMSHLILMKSSPFTLKSGDGVRKDGKTIYYTTVFIFFMSISCAVII